MNTCASPKSSLDGSAAEFVPCEELRQELSRRTAISAIKELLEPIFEKGGVHFRRQLDQIKLVASNKNVNASRLIGDILGDVSTLDSRRTPTGFRFFKQLRSILPVSDGRELEAGLIGRVHQLTLDLISCNSLEHLMFRFVQPDATASSLLCDEAGGDKPDQSTAEYTDRLFGVLLLLNLLITRLNLSDSPEECVCLPPGLPCVDMCQLAEATCRLQLTFHRRSFSDDPNFVETTLFDHKNWASFVYQICDSFSQCLLFFNFLLTQANSRLADGSWSNGADLANHANGDSSENAFGTSATVSSLMNTVLAHMRELLLEERLPSRLMRTVILDLLLTSSQIATYPVLPAELESASNGSDGDEVYECYQHFLEETNQVPTV